MDKVAYVAAAKHSGAYYVTVALEDENGTLRLIEQYNEERCVVKIKD